MVNQFNKEADAYLDKAIGYLKKNFDFDSKLKLLPAMNLSDEPKYEQFAEIVDNFNVENINMDDLFEEFVLLKKFYHDKILGAEKLELVKMWMLFLNTYKVPNFEKIAEYIFSLPSSNAASERIFSLMFYLWRKDRNRLAMKTVESELMIKQNFDLSCAQFYDYLNSEKGEKILLKAMSSEKY